METALADTNFSVVSSRHGQLLTFASVPVINHLHLLRVVGCSNLEPVPSPLGIDHRLLMTHDHPDTDFTGEPINSNSYVILL